MITIVIKSGSTDAIKNKFLDLIKKGEIESNKIYRLYCCYNTKTLDVTQFYFYSREGTTYQLDRMALGYNGQGPNDLLECARAAGFSEDILPEEWLVTKAKLEDDGETISFDVSK